jgi:hypothetical protein
MTVDLLERIELEHSYHNGQSEKGEFGNASEIPKHITNQK